MSCATDPYATDLYATGSIRKGSVRRGGLRHGSVSDGSTHVVDVMVRCIHISVCNKWLRRHALPAELQRIFGFLVLPILMLPVA